MFSIQKIRKLFSKDIFRNGEIKMRENKLEILGKKNNKRDTGTYVLYGNKPIMLGRGDETNPFAIFWFSSYCISVLLSSIMSYKDNNL